MDRCKVIKKAFLRSIYNFNSCTLNALNQRKQLTIFFWSKNKLESWGAVRTKKITANHTSSRSSMQMVFFTFNPL